VIMLTIVLTYRKRLNNLSLLLENNSNDGVEIEAGIS
jgi:hypothetical protein